MKVDSQKSKVQGKLRKGVFFPAAGALVIFIGLVAAFPDKAYEVLTGLLYKMGGSCWIQKTLYLIRQLVRYTLKKPAPEMF